MNWNGMAIIVLVALSGCGLAFAQSPCGITPSPLVIGCYPINITNTQASATPLGFQQQGMQTPFNSLAGNVVIYNGISGEELPAWMENGSVFWFNMEGNALSATSSANGIYYVGVGAAGTNFFLPGNQVGEAPQYSPIYGKYDNGNQVFTFYDDFAGSSLDSNWGPVYESRTTYTVANKLSVTWTSGGGTMFDLATPKTYSYPLYIDSLLTSTSTDGGSPIMIIGEFITNTVGSHGYESGYGIGQSNNLQVFTSSGGSSNLAPSYPYNLPPVVEDFCWCATGQEYVTQNYTQYPTSYSDTTTSIGNYYLTIIEQGTSYGRAFSVQWYLARQVPPNNVMPTLIYGSFQAVSNPIGTPILANVPSAPAALDEGQNVVFTATANGGVSPYSYNFLVINSISGATVANMLKSGGTSASFTWITAATGTFKANVIVTDAQPTTANSAYSGIFTVNAPLSASISPPNVTAPIQTSETLTATITGGTPPYSYIWHSGISSSCALDGGITRVTSNQITVSLLSSAYYCYNVTDSATLPVNASPLAALINVVLSGIISNPGGGTGSTTSSITTSTTIPVSITSSSSSTIQTTTVPQAENQQACKSSDYLIYGFALAMILIIAGGILTWWAGTPGIIILAIGLALLISVIGFGFVFGGCV